MVGKSNNTLVSFDDEESVALKEEYVIQNNAGGIVIWPFMGDYLIKGKTRLLNVIHQKFHL